MTVFVLFTLTVLPLIFTPGPDMLFILSQVMGKDAKAGMMATLGICLGYLVHSVLVALGIAAIIVSFPVLFDAIRYLGIAYLLYLAFHLFKSVLNNKILNIEKSTTAHPVRKGFFTALLNPKGMLIYFAILPQFIDPSHSALGQSLFLALLHFIVGTLWQGILVYMIFSANRFMLNPHVRQSLDLFSGIVMLLLGVRLLLERR